MIGAVGRLSGEKGFDLLMKAVDQLVIEGFDLELWIAGEGDGRQGLEEVRALLGTPKRSNVREYEDRGVTGWYYPKPKREAAAVYFQEKKGELKVYKLDFEAVKAEDAES